MNNKNFKVIYSIILSTKVIQNKSKFIQYSKQFDANFYLYNSSHHFGLGSWFDRHTQGLEQLVVAYPYTNSPPHQTHPHSPQTHHNDASSVVSGQTCPEIKLSN